MDDKGPTLAMSALRAAGAALDRAPQAAALALKKLSTECSGIAAPLAAEIVQAAQVRKRNWDVFFFFLCASVRMKTFNRP